VGQTPSTNNAKDNMPRLAGIDIPDNKKIRISLRYLYGIGPKLADDILAETGVNPDKRAKDLNSDEINKVQRAIEKYNVEGNLRRLIRENIDRLKRIGSYRGMRHKAGLPTRGQRTRSNGRTRRGRSRVTVGSMTKETAAKLDAAKSAK
jgi:small subunit ribosomal protein S13